jgi:hypothetical protein
MRRGCQEIVNNSENPVVESIHFPACEGRVVNVKTCKGDIMYTSRRGEPDYILCEHLVMSEISTTLQTVSTLLK